MDWSRVHGRQVHDPDWQTCAPVHGWPHPPQLSLSFCSSTQLPLHNDGADAGQFDAHANSVPLAAGAQYGAFALQTVPQAPQLELEPRNVAQPVPASAQSENPDAQVY